MDQRALDRFWDQVRHKYGVYLRIIEVLPEERWHDHPIPGMRTPAELVVHTSGSVVRDIAQGVARGEIGPADPREKEVATGLVTREDVMRFAQDCWAAAQQAVSQVGDEQLAATVATPWDMTFPGWVGFDILSDEFLHHRGQLSVYARACGVAPPAMWSFAENAEPFRPT